ncbi:AT-rich interactive domain-containing protein 4A-like [Leptidea sinapis]|uniref:AT-rich interactive domain-containing protein 4A-like n=1 Tax=Leptidea sinapis TaxID=189913 RepID=UPI0021C3E8B7|nr:AT-rich interactive domain-containing protein 4A-like [Leptidea sinapis]
MPSFAIIKIEDITNDETEEQTEPAQEVQDAITLLKQLPPLESIPMPPNTPPPLNKPDPESEPASSPIDTEEDKSEPDSPARIDVLPEPPPGFLLQSEGPKIAEKLLKTIPGSPAPDVEPPPRHHLPFACAPPHQAQSKAENRRNSSGPREASGEAREGAEGTEGREARREEGWGRRHALLDNTPPTTPTTPDSSLDLSPHRERRISERDSPSERKDEDDDRAHDNNLEADKPRASVRSRLTSESSSVSRARTRRSRRDTDDRPAALKYHFYVDLDPSWDGQTRIKVLMSRLTDLRKAYHSVKAELAAIDRRRKKLRRKEREAVKAAKLACS